ncbi:MAG TPA: hypothetical protein VFM79_05805 [Pelobium sp.]|nr:hypothetical protein [Pelobium sp.]
MSRLCIYPKDIMLITGKSERYGRHIIKTIKEELNKEKHQLITIDEFCDFMGLKSQEVAEFIK